MLYYTTPVECNLNLLGIEGTIEKVLLGDYYNVLLMSNRKGYYWSHQKNIENEVKPIQYNNIPLSIQSIAVSGVSVILVSNFMVYSFGVDNQIGILGQQVVNMDEEETSLRIQKTAQKIKNMERVQILDTLLDF